MKQKTVSFGRDSSICNATKQVLIHLQPRRGIFGITPTECMMREPWPLEGMDLNYEGDSIYIFMIPQLIVEKDSCPKRMAESLRARLSRARIWRNSGEILPVPRRNRAARGTKMISHTNINHKISQTARNTGSSLQNLTKNLRERIDDSKVDRRT